MTSLIQLVDRIDWIRVIDVVALLLGLLYLWLEYKANVWLWVVSIIMPIEHGYLYYARGLYADAGMEFYYVAAAIYGLVMWLGHRDESGKRVERPITHFPARRVLPTVVVGLALWGGLYWLLTHFTDSTVPVADAFTTALSIVALWALAQKYVEQWLLWFVVDLVCTLLYIYKQIPFTAALYAFYTLFALFGYHRWKSQSI